MFNDKNHFTNHQPQETTIEVANRSSMTGLGVGTVCGSNLGAPLSLSGAPHVPDLKCNLVSLVQLAQNGYLLVFKENGCFEVTQGNEVALSGLIVDVLMELDLKLGKSAQILPSSYVAMADGTLLHRRLGNPGSHPFLKDFPGETPPAHCDPCVMAKHH